MARATKAASDGSPADAPAPARSTRKTGTAKSTATTKAAGATKAATTAKAPGATKAETGVKASGATKAAGAARAATAASGDTRPPATARAAASKAPAGTAPSKAPAPRAGGAKLDKFLEGQLTALEEERATYLRQAESLRAEADLLASEREPGDVQFDEESGEGDTLAVERERDLALSAQAQAAVEQIDSAMERIAAGTYGTCEACGSAIPKERLKALPYAALCVQCKSSMGFTRR